MNFFEELFGSKKKSKKPEEKNLVRDSKKTTEIKDKDELQPAEEFKDLREEKRQKTLHELKYKIKQYIKQEDSLELIKIPYTVENEYANFKFNRDEIFGDFLPKSMQQMHSLEMKISELATSKDGDSKRIDSLMKEIKIIINDHVIKITAEELKLHSMKGLTKKDSCKSRAIDELIKLLTPKELNEIKSDIAMMSIFINAKEVADKIFDIILEHNLETTIQELLQDVDFVPPEYSYQWSSEAFKIKVFQAAGVTDFGCIEDFYFNEENREIPELLVTGYEEQELYYSSSNSESAEETKEPQYSKKDKEEGMELSASTTTKYDEKQHYMTEEDLFKYIYANWYTLAEDPNPTLPVQQTSEIQPEEISPYNPELIRETFKDNNHEVLQLYPTHAPQYSGLSSTTTPATTTSTTNGANNSSNSDKEASTLKELYNQL